MASTQGCRLRADQSFASIMRPISRGAGTTQGYIDDGDVIVRSRRSTPTMPKNKKGLSPEQKRASRHKNRTPDPINTPSEEDTTMLFNIEVQDRRNGQWRERKTGVPAASANEAVKSYVVSCKRARQGHARSKSGKLFRAIEV